MGNSSTTAAAAAEEPLPAGLPSFTREQVGKHSSEADAWIIVKNRVFDVTKFVGEHPGGKQILLDVAGKDATSDFADVGHSDSAVATMKKFLVGGLAQ